MATIKDFESAVFWHMRPTTLAAAIVSEQEWDDNLDNEPLQALWRALILNCGEESARDFVRLASQGIVR
jgi:hypothetical protein